MLVRPLQSSIRELLSLHGRRIGRPEAVELLHEPVVAMVSGALPGWDQTLEASTLLGDPERARGTGLLLGSCEELRRAGLELPPPPPPTTIGRRRFEWGTRTFVMGIVNTTPDSFSDGGRHRTAGEAIETALRMVEAGVDLLDVGGESTRPGAEPVEESAELERVLPVVEALARRTDVPISIDTTKARVAELACEAGAVLVNDISGFRFDPAMAGTIARAQAAACVMHLQGDPRTMQQAPSYFDVVGEVLESLDASVTEGVRAGIPREKLLVDPGIGFGKTLGQNLFLLRNLSQFAALGRPLLIGASRKGMIGALTGLPVERRLPGSLAVATAAAMGGADIVRVHDVPETIAALKMADAIRHAEEGGFAFLP